MFKLILTFWKLSASSWQVFSSCAFTSVILSRMKAPHFLAFLDPALLWLYLCPPWEGAWWTWYGQHLLPYTMVVWKGGCPALHPGYFKQRAIERSTAFCHFSFQIDISSNAEAMASKKNRYLFFKLALKQKENLMWSSDLVIKWLRRWIASGQAYASGYKFSYKCLFSPLAFPDLFNWKIFFCGSILMGC